MLNLDTHIVLHALTGDLSRRERVLLSGDSWSISAIVIWEIGKLAELGRIEVDLDDPELGRTLHRIHVWPLTLEIYRAIRALDVRSDPADEIIAATSMVHRAPLVTRDRKLLTSRRVPLAR
jgi:PIN domain nuclease of toxin-antitoxin system